MNELSYLLALSFVPGIGAHTAKKLIAHCGSAEAVFKEKQRVLEKVPGVGAKIAQLIKPAYCLELAEEERTFMQKHKIRAISYLSPEYPKRLSHCIDAPIVLYTKGETNFNPKKAVSIVGTRSASNQGKAFCRKLIEELSRHDVLIVSGLAYGIDITAHEAALENGLQTAAVLAGSLNKVYPSTHQKQAKRILDQGALISDNHSKVEMMPGHFAERNRIIAGMTDAVIVIESQAKGGSIITADLANGYNRDVFAVPGKPGDKLSEGCNKLIKSNRAALLESAKDIEYLLGWEAEENKTTVQHQLFQELTENELAIKKVLEDNSLMSIDRISLLAELSMSNTNAALLSLEFKGLVKAKPGKLFEWV